MKYPNPKFGLIYGNERTFCLYSIDLVLKDANVNPTAFPCIGGRPSVGRFGYSCPDLILGCHTGDGHGSRHLLLGDDHRPRIVGGEAVVGCNVVHYIRK